MSSDAPEKNDADNDAEQRLRVVRESSPLNPVSGRLVGLFGLDRLPLSQVIAGFEICYWIHILTILGFLVYIPGSKHLHLLAAVPKWSWSAEPTVGEVTGAIAKLGGHLKSNGRPGWLVLGRGYQEMLQMQAGRGTFEITCTAPCAVGVDAKLVEYERMFDAFHAFVFLKAARQCWRDHFDFIEAHSA